MKKLLSYLCILCTSLSLCACSSKVNQEDVVNVFHAFNKTLQMNSALISGNVEMNHDNMIFTLEIIQDGNLECAFDLDLEAGGNKLDDFLSFYIKDQKTYLNSSGTTSQSVLKNIGIDPTKKLSAYNPFLDFTDKELVSFFESTEKNGNTYTLQMDGKKLATLLDGFGTVSISKATLVVTLDKDVITDLKVSITGYQAMDSSSSDVDIGITCHVENFNQIKEVHYPADLENY